MPAKKTNGHELPPFPPDHFNALIDLTLRDLFAAFALGGLAARPDWSKWTDAEAAEEAYSVAEAMLIRREKFDPPA